MEINELDREIFNWRKVNRGEVPFVIEISNESMGELYYNKNLTPHITMNKKENKIIGYEFKGIPLCITDKVETYRFYSKQESERKVK